MDSESEEPPLKRRRYERSSTPIRELAPLVPPDLPPLREARENGLVGVEELIHPAPLVAAESDTEQERTLCAVDNVDGQGPDYFGLSNEAISK